MVLMPKLPLERVITNILLIYVHDLSLGAAGLSPYSVLCQKGNSQNREAILALFRRYGVSK